MKKFISWMLVFSIICCSCLISFAADSNEAKIISPNNGEWVDPYKAITIKWTTPSSGLNYKVTIKNERTGKYIVQNEKVSDNSYSIKSNVLDFEERYIIWVGTYDGSNAVGHGDSIAICVNDINSSQKVYEEADFLYPSNNQEIPAGKDLKITMDGNSDLAYNLTVKDTTIGRTIAEETGLTKTSYTIKSSLLTEGHSYRAWVGTYKRASIEKKLFGSGKTVDFKVEKAEKNDAPEKNESNAENDSEQNHEVAEILYPSDKEWLDPTNKITIKWNKPASDLEYCITIKDDVSGEYIVKNEYTNKDSYNIGENTLTAEHRYKISLSTHVDDTLVGSDEICINMNDVDYEEADFSSPLNEDAVDASSKVTIKFSNINSDFCYRFSIVDTDTNKSIIKNKVVSGNTYSLNANTLEQGKEYKLWIGTYINSNASEAVGKGNAIYIYTEEEEKEIEAATVEAVFSSPENDDVVNYKKDLTIKWKKSNVDTCFELTIKDTTDNSFIVKNEIVSGTSYKIKSSNLKAKHQYKAWIGTYNNSSDDKRLIGKGDEIYFSTDGTIPVLVKSLNADLKDKGLTFEYEFTGDDFGYAAIVVTDSKDKTIYNEKVYDLNGEIIIVSDKLEENCTYTCEIQTYTSNGEKAAYKAQKYTVAKSGFSVTGVTKPTGELTYKKGFTVKGVVGSAYPITEAEIVIFTKGNENDIKDIVHLKNYNQTSKNPTQFNIKDYDSEVNFGLLIPGEYTYRVSVVDTMGNSYTVVESNFSVVREKGTYDDVPSDHKNYEAIKQLSLDGILAGDGTGKFRPNDSITRAEFVKMLYFAFELSPVSSRDLRSSFSDVDTKHWAYTYIMSAFNKNIINGKGNDKFAPSDNVTFEETAKMLICIKGWQDTAEQNGGWAGGGYITVANNNNFFESTSIANNNYKRNASRADIAQMFFNALKKTSNSVNKADKTYTVNGIKLYAYKYDTGYYVDAYSAMNAFNGGDHKTESNSNLVGYLEYWSNNIVQYGASLRIPYNFKNKNYDNIEIEFSDGSKLCSSEQKKYFKKTTIQMTVKNGKPYINIDDLAMITECSINGTEIVDEKDLEITIKVKSPDDSFCYQYDDVSGYDGLFDNSNTIFIKPYQTVKVVAIDEYGSVINTSESGNYTWRSVNNSCKIDKYGSLSGTSVAGNSAIELLNRSGNVVARATVFNAVISNLQPIDFLEKDSYINLGNDGLIKNITVWQGKENYTVEFDYYNALYVPLQFTTCDSEGNIVDTFITSALWQETGVWAGIKDVPEAIRDYCAIVSGRVWDKDYVMNDQAAIDENIRLVVPNGGYIRLEYPMNGNDAEIATVVYATVRSLLTVKENVDLIKDLTGVGINTNNIFDEIDFKACVAAFKKEFGKAYSLEELTTEFFEECTTPESICDYIESVGKTDFINCIISGIGVGLGAGASVVESLLLNFNIPTKIAVEVMNVLGSDMQLTILMNTIQRLDDFSNPYRMYLITPTTQVDTHSGVGRKF